MSDPTTDERERMMSLLELVTQDDAERKSDQLEALVLFRDHFMHAPVESLPYLFAKAEEWVAGDRRFRELITEYMRSRESANDR